MDNKENNNLPVKKVIDTPQTNNTDTQIAVKSSFSNVFTPYERLVHYHETDKMGIVHHSNFIKWLEEARVDVMSQLGFSYDEMERMGIISPVLSISCDYRGMVKFNDTVLVYTNIESYNGVKMTLSYIITDKKSGEVRASATSGHCFLDSHGRPISLKKQYPLINDKLLKITEKNK
ncbi:MAG: acyl-CoA thioesterase [Lachnospiraceae bacterium]|nr:acyl-CoA thioesterase [Lachnospiraceae bacterium]